MRLNRLELLKDEVRKAHHLKHHPPKEEKVNADGHAAFEALFG